MATKLLLVGCGKMGGAFLQRVAHEASVCAVDPAPADQFKASSGVAWLSAPEEIDARFVPDIIILAVKPQQMAAVLPAYARFRESVFLSIAAGRTLMSLASILGSHQAYAIVRAMPSLLATIGQSPTVAIANKNVKPPQRALCDKVLNAVGKTSWVEEESWLDPVTALSGSGPAYVFALAEAMTKAGEALGLPPSLAAQLARQTVAGGGALLAESAESAAALQAAVTSPGGTTEAALKQLLAAGGLNDLMLKAMKAAAHRAKDLAQ